MTSSRRALFVWSFTLASLLPTVASAQAPPVGGGPASALLNPVTPQWFDSEAQYSTITNCVSIIQGLPYQERGAAAYVGFFGSPEASQPLVDTTYYIHVVVAGLGNACGGMRFFVDVALPASTALAVDSTNRVVCLVDGSSTPANECPQTLPDSPNNAGAFALPSVDTAHGNLWPLPSGHIWEFRIPVRSTSTLSGSQLRANVWVADGNGSPWLRPQKGVYVFGGAPLPTFVYPSPAATSITTTTAHVTADLYAFGLSGTGWFELGTDTNYGASASITVPSGGASWELFSDWSLLMPDTDYHWRARFQASNGTWYDGADQTFHTRAIGRTTVGTGTAASCTESAFVAALTAPETLQITFACGSSPVTIALTAPRTISSTMTIDGGNVVTLQRSGIGNLLSVTATGNLTLSQIALTGGVNGGCGGAISVAASGRLTLTDARLVGNGSLGAGGAVCNAGTVSATRTLFSGNQASTTGGAIQNTGTITLTDCRLFTNSASTNGGAIYSSNTVVMQRSRVTGNTANGSGGGIHATGGKMELTDSSVLQNTAGTWGGGLANDANQTTVTGSTFAGNFSRGTGGAIATRNGAPLSITNSTISGNTALAEGGGIHWPAAGAAGVTVLQSTIVANTAGTTGHNIWVGGAGSGVDVFSLRNTIVAYGPGAENCNAGVTTVGGNLDDGKTCHFGLSSDFAGVDPLLGPLQDNGGPTRTRVQAPGSPAIDTGVGECVATDQRGVSRPKDGSNKGAPVCDIGATEVVFLNFAAPTSIAATATSASQVAVAWSAVSGATLYEVWRSSLDSGFALVTTTGGLSFNDTGLASDTTYLYKVRGYSLSGSSPFSAVDAATTTIFTDASLSGGVIKAVHLDQLRTAVNAMRVSAGLPAFAFTDPTLTVRATSIKATHVASLRQALDNARALAGLPALTYTDPILTLRTTPVKAVHLMEIRAGTR